MVSDLKIVWYYDSINIVYKIIIISNITKFNDYKDVVL